MTDATGQSIRKSGAAQSRARTAPENGSTFRSCRATGAGLLYIASSGISLSAAGAAAERPGRTGRSQAGVTVKLPHSLIQRVRTYTATKGLSISESSQPSPARAAAARARAWVSPNQNAHTPCDWNIDLTVCCQTGWRMFISCWYRICGGRSGPRTTNTGLTQTRHGDKP